MPAKSRYPKESKEDFKARMKDKGKSKKVKKGSNPFKNLAKSK